MNKGVKDIKFPIILLVACVAVALFMGVMIGGAPVNQDFCDAIGADYYTDDAASASDVAKAILEGK